MKQRILLLGAALGLVFSLAGKFQVPQLVSAGVPSEKQFADALAWAREKGYVAKDIAYADCVNASFLPK